MKKSSMNKAYLALATIISGTMIAMASTCSTCKQIDGHIDFADGRRCDYDTPLMLCRDPQTSEFECFENSNPTTVNGTFYEWINGMWVLQGTCTRSAKECWNDDTGCGGNG